MDPQERAFHMREQLKQIYRARLPDMGWCDDISQRKQQVEEAFRQVRGDWEAEANQYQSVITAACEASSTDNEHQTINLTLPNDRSFWSSRGHPSQVAHEALLYEVAGPACRVVSVKVAPYRALYQDGYPVYPPMRLQVWAGATPYSLQPASPWQDVQASDALQTFALWPHAPLARYLQIRMYGKLQKQREDMQFYVAIRHVEASGAALSTPDLLSYQSLMRSSIITLGGPTPSLPASCTPALQTAADYAVGPCLAAAAATVQPTACQSQPKGPTPPLTQQTRGGSSSSSGNRASTAFCRLVSRPGVLQEVLEMPAGVDGTVDGTSNARQQQRQGQNSGGWSVHQIASELWGVGSITGLRSILGRRGAAAAAVTGPSDAGPSKRHQQHAQQQHQQQHQQSAPLLPSPPLVQQQAQRVPLWLAEDAAAAAALPIQHREPQQQQRQQQENTQQQQHGCVPHADSFAADAALGADEGPQHMQSDTGMAGDDGVDVTDDDVLGLSDDDDDVFDTESSDEEMQQQQQQQQQQQHHHHEQQQQEQQGNRHQLSAAWQAAQRLHEQIARQLQDVAPWQQEQVLAELLADEPLGGRSAFRQRLVHLQQQHLQQQQQQPGADGPHPDAAAYSPPVVAILPGSNEGSSGSSGSSGSNGGSSGSNGDSWCEVSRGRDSGLVMRSRVVLDSSAIKAGWYLVDDMVEAMADADVHDQQRMRQRYAASYHAAAAAAAAAAAVASAASPRSESAAAGSQGSCPMSLDAAAASDTHMVQGTPAGQQPPQQQQQQQASGVSAPTVPELPDLVCPKLVTSTAAAPAVTAKHLFQWKPTRAAAAGRDVAGCGSSAAAQHAWSQPASLFCEGLEADLWVC